MEHDVILVIDSNETEFMLLPTTVGHRSIRKNCRNRRQFDIERGVVHFIIAADSVIAFLVIDSAHYTADDWR